MPTANLDIGRHREYNRNLSTLLEALSAGDFDSNEVRHSRVRKPISNGGFWKYSECQLTKYNDILVAISGIAKIMARAVDDEQGIGGEPSYRIFCGPHKIHTEI